MRYYIIAGEASGDLHGSNLIREITDRDADASFRCWGGDLMQQQGAELVMHYRDLAYMGFMEVVSHLPVILKNFRFCKNDILAYKPDVLILVDYPGFNLRMARFASRHGIPVFYFISPQLWAWRSSRVKAVKAYVSRMFVILPFEKEFYARFGYPVDFVGHPLLDVIDRMRPDERKEQFLLRNHLTDLPLIALLPGSRKMEIGKILRTMLTIVPEFPDHQFVIAAAPSIPEAFYREIIRETKVSLLSGQTYPLLSFSEAALVASGTATLETALMNVPQVVCYKGNILSYAVARRIVQVKHISLVNLILEKSLIHELIQNSLTTANLKDDLHKILHDQEIRTEILKGYSNLHEILGGKGASGRAAALMIQYLQKK